MIKAVYCVVLRQSFCDFCFATAKVANCQIGIASFFVPTDHFLVWNLRPVLALFSIQRMVMFPFLWITRQTLVCGVAAAGIPCVVECRKITKFASRSLNRHW